MADADPSLAIQAAVVAALKASAALTALVDDRIYDRVPAQLGRVTAEFPYLKIGDDHIVGDPDQVHDPSDVYVKVECWSRAVGRVEAKRINAAVRAALDHNLTLTGGHEVVARVFVDSICIDQPDGLTTQGIVNFHYITQPTA